jgi:hypothetical protein
LPKNKRFYTFDDLRKSSSPFLPIISEGNIVMEKTSDWICEEYRRNDLTYLFNLAVRKYCQKRELYYDKDHRRFVCRLKNERTNFFVWRPETKFATRRIASLVRAEDGSVLYGRHYAARLGIVFIDSDLFLKIEPTMTFTYDGHRPIQAKRLASLMSRYLPKQYNNAYLDFVRFWGKFLSKLDANISIPVGEGTIEIDSNPIATPVAVGIAKERGS